MINYFVGDIVSYGDTKILKNDLMGIEVIYEGSKSTGEFFLYGYYDENIRTYRYYAFDKMDQKKFFFEFYKLPGIGPKTAYFMSSLPEVELKEAIEKFDVKYFQALPGIGPKTAKRILVEMKNTFKASDLEKVELDDKIVKDVTSALKPLGYEIRKVKKVLLSCPLEMKKDKLSDIIKWVIDNM